MNILGGLNYDAKLSAEDYRSYRDLLENEILTRFRLASGSPPLGSARFGIVDVLNPAQISSSETSRAGLVRISTVDPLKVDINPAMIVTPNGAIAQVPAQIGLQVLEASGSAFYVDRPYMILCETSLNAASGKKLPNDYGVALWSQELPQYEIKSFRAPVGWVPASNQTVLAVVTALQTGVSSYTIQIDLSQNIYAFNRPWFTIIDQEHRSFVGSGQVTPQNPHGISVNDLTPAGSVSLFAGLGGTGLVVSRDRYVNKMVGAKFCVETVPFTRIKTDSTGLVTAGSPYGRIGAKYIELEDYPTRLGSVMDSSTPSYALAAEMKPRSNILVFSPLESFTATQVLIVEYTATQALQPPTNVISNLLTFGNPIEDEVIVSGGYTLAALPDPTISLEGAGPFAREYVVYQNPNATLVSFPQILSAAQTINTSLVVTNQPSFPSRIGVGITNTTGPAFNVQVTLNGTDADAAPITEVLTFNAQSNYSDQLVPSTNYDLPGQIQVTSLQFASVTSMSITGILGTEKLQVWAEITAGEVPAVNDWAAVARVQWNGQAIQQVLDQRILTKNWSKKTFECFLGSAEVLLDAPRLLSSMQGSSLLTGTSLRLITEDFEDLRYFDTHVGFADPTLATGTISLNPSVAFTNGDQITLTTSPLKIITAVTAAPVASTGQFQIGGSLSLSDVRNNIVAAINDSGFASNVVATADSGVPTNINLVLQSPGGTGGNTVQITKTLANPLSASVSGFNAAFDGYGEAYMNRYVDGLQSTRIPNSSQLNPYQYGYRNRYRSRAIGFSDSIGNQTKFAVLVHGEDRNVQGSLRIRGSLASNPNVWLPWAVMTATPNGLRELYRYTFGQPVHKIQIEYYGTARGLSAYMLEG